MKPTARFLPDTPVYKDFAILFMQCNSDRGIEFRGRAENFAVPGGFEHKITFDSEIHRSINDVYRELIRYIDKYRKVN